MTRCANYDNRYEPPAPVAEVKFRNPRNGKELPPVRCILDTGASSCFLPMFFIEELGATWWEEAEVEDYEDRVHDSKAHYLLVAFCGRELGEMLVVEQSQGDPIVGRDVLNRFVVKLNGPELVCEVT